MKSSGKVGLPRADSGVTAACPAAGVFPGAPAEVGGQASGERGGITLMLVILFVGLLAMAGIVIDGGAKLTEAENAAAAAQEAARAGAGIVDPARAYSTGSFTVARTQALAAARSYIAAAGYQGTAAPLGANSIQVTVIVTEPTRVLSIIGIDSITSTGTATAELVTGVTGPGT
jgi:Flp pilus assembly protein TadG